MQTLAEQFEKLLEEQKKENIYLKGILQKVASIESELVNARLKEDRENAKYTVKLGEGYGGEKNPV
ncbi:hypothetical protein CCP3SC15_420010 [Gammaproteobacteria bacterium]